MGVEQLQIAKSGSASEFYRNAVLLQQGAEILQGKNYPIVAVARDNLNEAVRFKNNRLFYQAHDEMSRALISHMNLGQKMELLKQYTQSAFQMDRLK